MAATQVAGGGDAGGRWRGDAGGRWRRRRWPVAATDVAVDQGRDVTCLRSHLSTCQSARRVEPERLAVIETGVHTVHEQAVIVDVESERGSCRLGLREGELIGFVGGVRTVSRRARDPRAIPPIWGRGGGGCPGAPDDWLSGAGRELRFNPPIHRFLMVEDLSADRESTTCDS